MAQVLKESPITTPSARAKLVEGLHWRRLDADTHLGYRKAKRAGVWVVRWRQDGSYRQATLGTADDTIKEGTLGYDRAALAARGHVEAARMEAKAKADGPLLTVRSSVQAYIASRDARDSKRAGREVTSDAGQRLARYVLGQAKRGKVEASALVDVPLHLLTEDDLRSWMECLPSTFRPATLQRLVNDLKAALNETYSQNRSRLPASMSEAVRFGLKVKTEIDVVDDRARASQILTDAEVSRLLKAAQSIDVERWGDDLYHLLLVLAATGARFAQVRRLQVRDVQRETKRLLVPVSHKGKGKTGGYCAVPVGQDVIDALQPILTGRDGDEPLLLRWRWGQAPGSIEWIRDRRGPWQSSSEFSRAWQAIKKAAKLDVDPYAFRHSSIVRGIRAGLPIRLVAALHDTSVAMIEKHYSRWITDGLDELAATAVVPLVPASESNVVRIAR